jgi:hypothetical protein
MKGWMWVLVALGVGACDKETELRAGPFACGEDGLTCEGAREACAGQGQGACMGQPPGEDGCPANCEAYTCGGTTPVCLCSTFRCVDLGGCTDCACAEGLAGPSCLCDDSNGVIVLSCPGA